MKKTRFFIFITVLLMTLLTVVGCDNTPILSPETSESQFVSFKVSVNNKLSRDLDVVSVDYEISYYKVALIPEWNPLVNGAPIYGQIGERNNGIIEYGETQFDTVEQIDLGYVTPGKWTVYVAAFTEIGEGSGKREVVLMDGFSSTYVNANNNSVTIILSPNVSTELSNGSLNCYIYVPRLSNNHENDYAVTYTLYDSKNTIVKDEEISGSPLEINDSQFWYSFGNTPVSLKPGEYIGIIQIVDKKTNTSIGGITKKVNIVSGCLTNIVGSLSPSEFIDVGVEFENPLPVIRASVSDDVSSQVKGNEIVFTCTDSTDQIDNYTKAYYWFIDGELITKASTGGKWTVTNIADNGNTSSMSCIFNSYGKREIKCEIVYIPNVSQGDKLIRYVGGDSTFVEIVK